MAVDGELVDLVPEQADRGKVEELSAEEVHSSVGLLRDCFVADHLDGFEPSAPVASAVIAAGVAAAAQESSAGSWSG